MFLMSWQTYIERIPGLMLGKPVFRGTHITVEFVLERLALGATADELVRSYPPLSAEHIMAALSYAVAVLQADELPPSAT
jgi:uncharacterized protein (DUF433 family)